MFNVTTRGQGSVLGTFGGGHLILLHIVKVLVCFHMSVYITLSSINTSTIKCH